MQALDVPDRLCLLTTVAVTLRQDYSLVFLLSDQCLFSVSVEERILQARVVDLQQQFVVVRGTTYHGQLVFVIDQMLSWSLFAFGKSNQTHKQRFREAASSKDISLFDSVHELSNQQRKSMHCLMDAVRLNPQLFVVELQLDVCVGCPSLLEFRTDDKQTSIRKVQKDHTFSLAYQHILKGKKAVAVCSAPSALELAGSGLLKSEQFYSKFMVLRQEHSNIQSLYSFLVERSGYQLHIGRNILCNIGAPLLGFFFIERFETVMLCLPNTIILYNLRSDVTRNSDLQYATVTEVENGRYLLSGGTSQLVVLLQIQEGLSFTTKALLKDLTRCHSVVACSSQLNDFYMLDTEGSVHLLRTQQGKCLQATEIYSNCESKVVAVKNKSDRYGGLLSVKKQVGSVSKTQLLSNQPHSFAQLVLEHNLPALELCDIIGMDEKPTFLLSSSHLGTAFVDCLLQQDRLIVRNNEDYSKFEVRERTLLFRRAATRTIQVTETKIIVQQQQATNVVELRSLFENMSITADQAILLNSDAVLGLTIREQLHLFAIRSKIEPLFIYCFDMEIERLFALSGFLLIAVKLFGKNSLDFYRVDLQQETLQPLNSIQDCCELALQQVHSLPIQINAQHHVVSLVGRRNAFPWLLFAPNEPGSNRAREVLWCEMRALPLDYCAHIVRVSCHQEADKHVLLARDIFLAFPRSCVLQGPATNLVVQCMRTHRSHSRIELPLWVQQTAKANTYVQIGLRSVTLWEDAYKKTDQPSETEVLYDYDVQTDIDTSGTLSVLSVRAYSLTTDRGNPLWDENFSKITAIRTIESSLTTDGEELPRKIACFTFEGQQLSKVKWLKGSISLLCFSEEVWLVRFVLKGNRFVLQVYSKFSMANEAFIQFQNRLPRSDLDRPAFMTVFKTRHTIRQLELLDCSGSFTGGSNYLLVLFAASLLVLQIDRMVFKIHQTIELEQGIDFILDNFREGSAYLRGSNHLFLLAAGRGGKFELSKQQELDDNVVFASTIDNWLSRWRHFRAHSGEPLPDSSSTIIVKEFGQLEIRTTDRRGHTTESDVYV